MVGLWLGERGLKRGARRSDRERERRCNERVCLSIFTSLSSPGLSSLSFLLVLPLVILIYRVFPCYSELLFIHYVGSPISAVFLHYSQTMQINRGWLLFAVFYFFYLGPLNASTSLYVSIYSNNPYVN